MRAIGLIAFAGVVAFFVICAAAQLLRTDLDWIATPLSLYLTGPGGYVVKVAYIGLSVSLLLIGYGFYRKLAPEARSAAPLLLFSVAGVALSVTALSEIPAAADPTGIHAYVHGIAAMTTFLCVTVAMLLQSWRLRGDARWRGSLRLALALALAAFVALWIYTLARGLPRGLMQKGVIVLILTWLGWASLALWRREAATTHGKIGN
jgi:hypothetical protein